VSVDAKVQRALFGHNHAAFQIGGKRELHEGDVACSSIAETQQKLPLEVLEAGIEGAENHLRARARFVQLAVFDLDGVHRVDQRGVGASLRHSTMTIEWLIEGDAYR
jgi:hypothetical protein